jgi:hypothetical protein
LFSGGFADVPFRFAIIAWLAATPALAQQGAAAIPEPGDAALFVLAVVGLVVGRQLSRRAPRDPGNDTDA